MKIVGMRDAKQVLADCMDEAQADHVLITRHGKPSVILLGVEGHSMEQIVTGLDEEVFRLVDERRRNSDTVSSEEADEILGWDD